MKIKSIPKYLWLVPVLVVLGCILRFGVNMPFGDEWSNITVYQRIDNGEVPVKYYLRQHNEHRILFPSVLSTVLAYPTKNNVKMQMLANLALAIASLLVLYSVLKQYSLLVALWWFTPIQAENWLWAFEICWFLGILGVVLSLKYLTEKASIWKAIIPAVIASYSVGIGLAIWPVGLLILYSLKQPKKWWLISGALTIATYFYRYRVPNSTDGNFQIIGFIQYYLAVLGGSVTQAPQAGVLVGGILLSFLVPVGYLVYKGNRIKGHFWIGLILFSLLSVFMISIGRSASGIPQALSSRYATFTVVYIVGLIGLTQTYVKKPIAQVLLISISIPLLISSYLTGFSTASQLKKDRLVISACTRAPHPSPECLHLVSLTDPLERTTARLEFLKHKGWSGY